MREKIAAVLDSTVAKADEVATRIAGDKGGQAAVTVVGGVLGPIRARLDVGCTRPGDCNHQH